MEYVWRGARVEAVVEIGKRQKRHGDQYGCPLAPGRVDVRSSLSGHAGPLPLLPGPESSWVLAETGVVDSSGPAVVRDEGNVEADRL